MAAPDIPLARGARVIDPFARYLCLSVDAGGYGRANDRDQSVIQDELLDVLAVAAAAAGLDRRRWHRQGQGDGEPALIPPSEPEARVVDDFIGELATSKTSSTSQLRRYRG
jgi:hypothetical protein